MSIHNIDNNINLIQEEQEQIQPTMNSSYTMIRSGDYYSTFYGHRARYLKTLLTSLRQIHTKKNNKPIYNTLILSFMMLLIGYSSFAVLVVRSNSNPPIDENNP